MSTTSAVILIIVIADLCFMFFVVRAIVSSNYGPLADDFPSDEIPPDAIYRRRQSFAFGLLNLGFSLAVALDERTVYLKPEPWARWMGIRPVSIPRETIRAIGKPRSKLMMHEFRIERPSGSVIELRGPGWLWEALSRDQADQRSDPD